MKYLPIYTCIRLISDKLTLAIQLRQFNFVLEGIRKYFKSKARGAVKILKLKVIPYCKATNNYPTHVYKLNSKIHSAKSNKCRTDNS